VNISVVIPCYNARDNLGRLLRSMARLEPAPLEIVVADDGSTDHTETAASWCPGVRVCRLDQNRGPAAARNHGVRHARGDVIVFLDSDCEVVDPHFLAKHLEVHASDPNCLLTGGAAVANPSCALARAIHYYSFSSNIANPRIRDVRPSHMAATVHASIRRKNFDRIGGFVDNLRACEDRVFYERARQHGLRTVIRHDLIVGHYSAERLGPIWRTRLTYGQYRIPAKRLGLLGGRFCLLPDNLVLAALMAPALAAGLAFETVWRWFRHAPRAMFYLPYYFIFSLAFALGPVVFLWRERTHPTTSGT